MDPRERFEDFYRGNFDRVVRATYLVLGSRDEAYDVAQDAFARTWLKWAKVEASESPVRFTFKVARNLARSRLRHFRRVRRLDAGYLEQPPYQDAFERVELQLVFDQAIRQLPPRQRWATVLVDWYGLTPNEAAAALGIAASTLRVHLARARHHLRAATEVSAPTPNSSGVPHTRTRRGEKDG